MCITQYSKTVFTVNIDQHWRLSTWQRRQETVECL